MPHNLDLIFTLTGGLTAALIAGFVAQRLKISPLVGYLLAGVAIGPFTPGFVAHIGIAQELAEIGVILLMFGVGLHFKVQEILAVRRVAIPGAIAQVVITTTLGVLVGRVAGFGLRGGLVFGLAISVASTVVLLRVLADKSLLYTRSGHIAVGWLLLEDLFTVLVLVLLPILAGARAQGGGAKVAFAIGGAVLKIVALVAFTLIIGKRTIPTLLRYVARTRSRELFTLTILVLALGIAVGSVELFGASMALGAFLAGLVVGQSEFSSRAASEALPMRDAFAVLFFVAMGMLFNPRDLVPNAALVATTLALVLLAKPTIAFVAMIVLDQPVKTAFSVAFALAQIGEFSFILAAMGRDLGVLPARGTQCLIAASILSIAINPLLFRLVAPLSRRFPQSKRTVLLAKEETPIDPTRRVLVIGYGPVGRTVVRLLRESDLEPTVIELNHETFLELRRQGIRAVHGDGSERNLLESAGVMEMGSLIYAASGSPEAVIRAAKGLNPEILVLARATFLGDVAPLERAGADVVVSAEGAVATAMTERLITTIGRSNRKGPDLTAPPTR